MKKQPIGRQSSQQKLDDRETLLGFLSLLSLALPALAIRALLPELNPLFLVVIGLVIYSAYIAWLFRMHAARSIEEQTSLKRIAVTVEQDQPRGQEGFNRE